jgi:hypothetical protein
VPGVRKARKGTEVVGLRMPAGLYREMMDLINRYDRWPAPARQAFIYEAVREKIEKEKGRPSGPDEGARETMRRVKTV